jgi:DNA-binding response OmpR family regulator
MPARVLIVDDERSIANMLQLILSCAGYECSVAYDGSEALRRAAEFQPHLLISDVMMPGMNGVELAKAIVHRDPTCLVLLFSGNAATQDLLQTADAEGDSFPVLAKPMPPRELLAAITQLVQGTQDSTRPPAAPGAVAAAARATP